MLMHAVGTVSPVRLGYDFDGNMHAAPPSHMSTAAKPCATRPSSSCLQLPCGPTVMHTAIHCEVTKHHNAYLGLPTNRKHLGHAWHLRGRAKDCDSVLARPVRHTALGSTIERCRTATLQEKRALHRDVRYKTVSAT